MSHQPLRIGLVGYGLGGRVFHAPLYAAAGVELVAVASSDAAKVHADFPDVTVHPTAQALFADERVELVDLASPSPTHAPLMLEALAAGKHVLSDKSFTTTVAEADAVITAAERAGRTVACYQNRRRDADFLTLRKLIDEGTLGDITRYEARFDRWAPLIKDRWQERDGPGVGVHFDLGTHIIDQALTLFGLPDWVEGDLQKLRGGTDPVHGVVDAFHARLGQGDRRIELGATLSAPDQGLRYLVQGTRGAWRKEHLDPQENQLRFDKLSPQDPRYGVEPESHHGTLTTFDGQGDPVTRRVPSERGDWASFYRELGEAIRNGSAPPVTAEQARDTIRVIEAITESSRTGQRVKLA